MGEALLNLIAMDCVYKAGRIGLNGGIGDFAWKNVVGRI